MALAHRLILDLVTRLQNTHAAPAEGGPPFLISEHLNITPEGAALVRSTLVASANEGIDLSGGLTRSDGSALVLTKLKGIIVVVDADGGKASLTQAAANGLVGLFTGASHGVFIDENDFFAWTSEDGIAITAGTGDLLNIAEVGTVDSMTYRCLVWGDTT